MLPLERRLTQSPAVALAVPLPASGASPAGSVPERENERVRWRDGMYRLAPRPRAPRARAAPRPRRCELIAPERRAISDASAAWLGSITVVASSAVEAPRAARAEWLAAVEARVT